MNKLPTHMSVFKKKNEKYCLLILSGNCQGDGDIPAKCCGATVRC